MIVANSELWSEDSDSSHTAHQWRVEFPGYGSMILYQAESAIFEMLNVFCRVATTLCSLGVEGAVM